MARPVRTLFSALLVSLAVAIAPSVASADLIGSTTSTATTIVTSGNVATDWTMLLPGLAGPYTPDDPNNICNAGKPQCVDSVAREMEKRLKPLSDSCSHNALFSLLYLDVTYHIGDAVRTAGYFQVPAVISHEDALFASYYFNAFDAYAKGDRVNTPGAWQVAFDSAKDKSVQGLGDVLLGMNAHINNDLPFVLYRMGLFNSNGTSRKPDHDKVNSVLFEAYDDAAVDSARRFDPSMAPSTAPGSGEASIQSVVGWREEAWRNAERLASAATDADRALVAAQISQAATLEAQAIKLAYSNGPGQSSADRDAYCAAHHNDV
ncbi:MAG TPA: DUF5995 family protein [Thermoleophilaceae bacterium]